MTPEKTPPPTTIFDYLPPAAQARFVQKDRGDFLDTPSGYAVKTVTAKSAHIDTYEEELNSALPRARDLLVAALKENPTPFTFPLKVIIAGNYEPDPDSKKTKEENAAAEAHWQTHQEALVSRSSSPLSRHLTAPNSDHFVMYYDHDMINQQIKTFYPR